MPLYEFVCSDCNTQFEAILSFSAPMAANCPACQSSSVTRMLSKPAIHFKGSGWYITDSKNSGKQSANGSSKGSNGDTASSEGTGKENGSSEGASKESSGKESTGNDSAVSTAPAAAAKGSSEKSAAPAAP